MNSTVKVILINSIGLIIGIVVGMIVNMGIITISGSIIPFPEGYNATDLDSMKTSFHLLETKHFIMPWFAHALGTLVGAIVVTKMAKSQQLIFSILIGCLFLAGGIMMIMELPSPTWFNIVDLGFAYIPMAWLGFRLAGVKKEI